MGAGARWAIRGQPVALTALQRALQRGRLPQALLLVGPAHVGKTTLALDLAAALLCTTADPAERPCRACPACRWVERGTHPDLHRLAPSGAGQQIRLGSREGPEPGTVRSLLSEFATLPIQGSTRVAVIEQAHRLNEDAQNALLKLLEEPPAGAVVCLAADDASVLLDTLRSRCTRLRLGTVDPAAIAALLVERGLSDPIRAPVIARAAGGLPGRAVALTGSPEALLTEDRLVRQLLDLLAATVAERLVAAAALRDDGLVLATLPGGGEASGLADEPRASDGDDPDDGRTEGRGEGRRDGEPPRPTRSRARLSPQERRAAVRSLLAVWASLGRDLAVAAAGGRNEIGRLDLLEELATLAPRLRPAELTAFLARLDGLDRAVEAYADPELVLDTLLLAWPELRRAA
ncbi:MAG TPA: hypothetical protein VFW92_10390 [Candidatus Limnocylindrales bacterium]|nr:hypothetical protein [Candidatus Limnocylindrales bacterium]